MVQLRSVEFLFQNKFDLELPGSHLVHVVLLQLGQERERMPGPAFPWPALAPLPVPAALPSSPHILKIIA